MASQEIMEQSDASATRLLNYLKGEPVYLGPAKEIYGMGGGNSMSYRPFDEGLMRHDIHVVLHFLRVAVTPTGGNDGR